MGGGVDCWSVKDRRSISVTPVRRARGKLSVVHLIILIVMYLHGTCDAFA